DGAADRGRQSATRTRVGTVPRLQLARRQSARARRARYDDELRRASGADRTAYSALCGLWGAGARHGRERLRLRALRRFRRGAARAVLGEDALAQRRRAHRFAEALALAHG